MRADVPSLSPTFSQRTRINVIDADLHSLGREITAIAHRDPHRRAIITTDGSVMTFGQLDHEVDAVAASFAASCSFSDAGRQARHRPLGLRDLAMVLVCPSPA